MSEDELILRLYEETSADEARRIDAHVAACASCRETRDELVATLKLVDAAEAPEPPLGFERVVWARVQEALPAAAAPRMGLRQWLPAVGLAATVVLAVVAGLRWSGAPAPVPAAGPEESTASAVRERVLMTALDGHFEQAERLLVELLNAPPAGEDEIAMRRATADDLVASGRLYRVTAEETGKVQVARVLDDLEAVLVDLANSPAAANDKDLDLLRTRIGDDDLLFKVRAMTFDLRGRTRTSED